MRGIVIFVFCIITIFLCEARSNKKPNIEVFEVRENQLTKDVFMKPINLQFDLESSESTPSKPRKNRVNNNSRYILKRLQDLKNQRDVLDNKRINYDLDDRESQWNLFSPQRNKNVDDRSRNNLKRLKQLKNMENLKDKENKKNDPLILILAPDRNGFEQSDASSNESHEENSFIDETRTKKLPKPANEEVYHIVLPTVEKKLSIPQKVPSILRSRYGKDRTAAPRGDNWFDYDKDNND